MGPVSKAVDREMEPLVQFFQISAHHVPQLDVLEMIPAAFIPRVQIGSVAFWLRVALRYRFDFVDEPLVKYRTGHANLSRRQMERVLCVRRILHRFFDELGGRARIEPELIRLTWADLYCDAAMIWSESSQIEGLAWYIRALATRPCHWPAWRGLAVSWWPDWLRSAVGQALRRADDSRRAPLPQDDQPKNVKPCDLNDD